MYTHWQYIIRISASDVESAIFFVCLDQKKCVHDLNEWRDLVAVQWYFHCKSLCLPKYRQHMWTTQNNHDSQYLYMQKCDGMRFHYICISRTIHKYKRWFDICYDLAKWLKHWNWKNENKQVAHLLSHSYALCTCASFNLVFAM